MDVSECKQKYKEKLYRLQKRLEAIRKTKDYLEKRICHDHKHLSKMNLHLNPSEKADKQQLHSEIKQLRREQKKAEKLYYLYDKKLRHKYREYKKYCKAVTKHHS